LSFRGRSHQKVIRELIQNGLPLLSLRAASAEFFQSTSRKILDPAPQRDRQQHAAVLAQRVADVEQQLSAVRGQVLPHASGMLVTAVGQDLDEASISQQLRDRRSGTEVVTVREGRAVVHAQSDLAALRAKIRAYATDDTRGGKPRFQALIARLDTIEPATIEDLSLGEIELSVPDQGRIWVEIWMPGGPGMPDDQRDTLDAAVLEFASVSLEAAVLEFAPVGAERVPPVPVYRGPERDVHLVSATGAVLKALPVLLPSAVEVHRAPLVRPIILAEAADQAGERAAVQAPGPSAAAIAVHDTGISDDHPYLQPVVLGASSVVPGAPSPADMPGGHGTQMAGVAAYSRLAEDVATGRIAADAWLVSVRLLESDADAGGDPDRGPLWAERTAESIATAEALAPQRPVIHNISLGADNTAHERADRTAWSVAADVLAWNTGAGRLLIVAAGNTEPITDRQDYPAVNLGPPHLQQPGQAWNVLTVGGYTDLDRLTTQDRQRGYPEPLACAGSLSPHSRVAPGGNRPLKPDLVMEAGNTAPGGGLDNPDSQGMTVLTLDSRWRDRGTLLRRTWATSPAAATASNALARLANAHPALRPATWRGLLAHTTGWPQAARQQLPDRRDLLRALGYGVPVPQRGMASDSNRPVMVYEGVLRPSHRNAERKPQRVADFIELPMPHDELDELADTPVGLAVTLSYFIEPTDNLARGTYAGARLRWDLQGPTENPESFRAHQPARQRSRTSARRRVVRLGYRHGEPLPGHPAARPCPGSGKPDRRTTAACRVPGDRLVGRPRGYMGAEASLLRNRQRGSWGRRPGLVLTGHGYSPAHPYRHRSPGLTSTLGWVRSVRGGGRRRLD